MATTTVGILVRRNDLYEQVWAEPMITMAKKYGISDVGLKKVCRKLLVPVPPRGYWAKLQHGKRVKKTPLPSLVPGCPSEAEINAPRVLPPTVVLPPEVTTQIAYEQDPAHHIQVPERLRASHPLVKMTADVLSDTDPDDYGMLRPWRTKNLDIRVSTKSLQRALRVMNALLQALAARGFQTTIVEATYHRFPETFVSILGEKVQFALEENVHRADRIPTDRERQEHQHNPSWEPYPRWIYTPTGLFTLKIKNYWPDGLRKTWSDGKTTRVEEILNEFVVGLVAVGVGLKKRQLEREREERERAEQTRLRLEDERRRQAEEAQRRYLEQDAVAWANADFVRRFIAEVHRRAVSQWGENQLPPDLHQWLTWANDAAGRLDPLSGGLERLLQNHASAGKEREPQLQEPF